MSNPSWIGNWTNSDGCQTAGFTRWKRQVNPPSGWSWERAADWLITNDTRQHNFSSVWRDNQGGNGMWVLADRRDNTSCDPGWIGEWTNSDGCQTVGFTRWKRRVNPKGPSWEDSADWLIRNDTRQHNFSSVWRDNQGGNGMWVLANRRDNTSCDPGWIGDWTNSDGCLADGQTRWKRRVDTKGRSWEDSADWLIANDTRHNFSSVWRDNQYGNGMWVLANRNDGGCVPEWSGEWTKGSCGTDGKVEFKRSINRKGYTPEGAVKYLNDNSMGPSYRAGSGYGVENSTKMAVTVDAAECKPSLGTWVEKSCNKEGTRNYEAEVDLKKYTMDGAVAHLKNNSMGGYAYVKNFYNWGKPYIEGTLADGRCVPTTSGDWLAQPCDSNGQRQYKIKVERREVDASKAVQQLTPNVKYMNKTGMGTDGNANIAVTVDDSACLPGWGNAWQQKECNADGTKKYEREVDPKKYTMGRAVTHLKDNSMGAYAFVKSFDSWPKTYIEGKIVDNECLPKWANNSKWDSAECTSDGKREYKRSITPGGYSPEGAVTYLNANSMGPSYRAGSGYGVENNTKMAVTVDAAECKPSLGTWVEKSCNKEGTRNYEAEVDLKKYTMDGAVAHLKNNSMGGYAYVKNFYNWGKPYIEGTLADGRCVPTTSGDWLAQPCDSNGQRQYKIKVERREVDASKAVQQLTQTVRYMNKTGMGTDGDANIAVTVDDNACLPQWSGTWVKKDCKDGGIREYKRQIASTKYTKWPGVIAYLNANSMEPSYRAGSGYPTDNSTMMAVAVPDDTCFATPEKWSTTECTDPTTGKSWTKLTVPNGMDWLKSATDYSKNIVNKVVNGKTVVTSTGRKDDSGAYSTITFLDSTCNPIWKDSTWKNDGCQSDGLTRYSRQVDARGYDWETAANWMIANNADLKAQNFITTKWYKDGPPATGIWIWGYKNNTGNDGCFVYNRPANNDGCTDLRKSTRAQQCNNWPNGWVASIDVVNACKTKAPAGSTVSINGAEVWAKWTVNDATCVATPEKWSDAICTPVNGVAKFWTKLSIPIGINWKTAGEDYTSTLTTVKNTRVTPVYREDKIGAYVDAIFPNSTCAPKSFILTKPYAKNEDLGKNIEGIPARFAQAITNAVPFI